MARQLRLEYQGAIYHIVSRGDRQEPIFADNADRARFVGTLGDACEKAEWQVHAYCLMGSHFHLVIETPKPTLVAGMKWLLGTYTQRFNARHRLRGHLFAGRYKSLIVDGSDDFYLRVVCDYVHLNPVRARLIAAEERLERYVWSSYPAYLLAPRRRPKWLRVDRLLGEHGIQCDSAAGRRWFSRSMEERRGEKMEFSAIRRGWRLGSEDFLERLSALGSRQGQREIHVALEVNQTMEAKARRLIAEALQAAHPAVSDLAKLPKAHPLKLNLAERLRRETTMTLGWIAATLHAGARGSLANALRSWRKPKYYNMRD